MKDEYYELRGWDLKTGLQTRAALEGLGLKDVADDLEARSLPGRQTTAADISGPHGRCGG